MYQLVLVLHTLSAVCLIVLVLIQQGKGATVGATFGAGASQTIFGSRGAGSFLLKVTLGFVMVFFTTSIGLNWMSTHAMKQQTQTTTRLPFPLQQPVEQPVLPPAQQPVSLPQTIPMIPAAPAPAVVPAIQQSVPAVQPAAAQKAKTIPKAAAAHAVKKHHHVKRHKKKQQVNP